MPPEDEGTLITAIFTALAAARQEVAKEVLDTAACTDTEFFPALFAPYLVELGSQEVIKVVVVPGAKEDPDDAYQDTLDTSNI